MSYGVGLLTAFTWNCTKSPARAPWESTGLTWLPPVLSLSCLLIPRLTRLVLDSFTTLLHIWGQTAYLLRGRGRANKEFWSQVLAESIDSWLAAYILLFLQAKCSEGQKDLSPRPDIRSSTWLKMVQPSGQCFRALARTGKLEWMPFCLASFHFLHRITEQHRLEGISKDHQVQHFTGA